MENGSKCLNVQQGGRECSVFKDDERSALCKVCITPLFLHELTQSLLIIRAYSVGCKERLEQNILDPEHMLMVLKVINKQIEKMAVKIHSIDCNDTFRDR